MKMSRRELRESIFLLLFRIEFNTREELQEQTEMFLEEKPDISEADSAYIRNKVDAILDIQDEIDRTIMKICTGWRLERLGKTELAILRLAVYEMEKDEGWTTILLVSVQHRRDSSICNVRNCPITTQPFSSHSLCTWLNNLCLVNKKQAL